MTAMKRSQTSDFYSRKPANFFDEENERQQRRPIPSSVSSHSMNEPRFSTNSSTSRAGAPSNPSGASNPFEGEFDEEVDEVRSIQTKIQQSKDSQLESQRRALKAIYESEQLGTGTAEVRTLTFSDICSSSDCTHDDYSQCVNVIICGLESARVGAVAAGREAGQRGAQAGRHELDA